MEGDWKGRLVEYGVAARPLAGESKLGDAHVLKYHPEGVVISAVIDVPSRRLAGYSRGTSWPPVSAICWMRRRIVSASRGSRNVIGLPISSSAES